MKVIASTDRAFKVMVKRITTRSNLQGSAVETTVRTILSAVARGGDQALVRYTKKYDKVSLKPPQFRVEAQPVLPLRAGRDQPGLLLLQGLPPCLERDQLLPQCRPLRR